MFTTGYASRSSLSPGEKIDFFLSADEPGPARYGIRRVGGPENDSFVLFVPTQTEPSTKPWEGFGWDITATFTVPDGWSTGLYHLEDRDGIAIVAFVVRPKTPGLISRILFQISFLTDQAYNSGGGKSLYFFNSQPGGREIDRASRVSFNRPASSPYREEALILWLESEGIPVEYATSFDLHAQSDLLNSYDCLLIAGHDEYWTCEIRNSIERFVDRGGNLALFSGNSGHRQVRLEDNLRTLVFHKYAGTDPQSDPSQVSVAFGAPPVNRPQQAILGAGFTWGAYGGSFNSPNAYKLHNHGHWALAGVSATTTPPFMTYETDAAAFDAESEGYPFVTGEEGTPLSFVILGTADLRTWVKPGFATLGVLTRSGTVFTSGTTDWIQALGDPVIQQITRNVLNHLRVPLPLDWEDIGHANGILSLTAANRVLLAVSSQDILWHRHPVGADVAWRNIGTANGTECLTVSGPTLYAVNGSNDLFWRAAADAGSPWTGIGTGPASGIQAMAAAGGMLYSLDPTGALWRRPIGRSPAAWARMTGFIHLDPAIDALASHGDILIAATRDGRLLRTDHDLISESSAWTLIRSAPPISGMGVLEGMLYAATTGNRLIRFNLRRIRVP